MADKTPARSATRDLPHSWDRKDWPADVWPNDPARAQWVLRAYRKELLAEGALTRIGKCVVVLGKGYQRFLEKRTHAVDGYSGPESRRAA